jgi:hypothetical protein
MPGAVSRCTSIMRPGKASEKTLRLVSRKTSTNQVQLAKKTCGKRLYQYRKQHLMLLDLFRLNWVVGMELYLANSVPHVHPGAKEEEPSLPVPQSKTPTLQPSRNHVITLWTLSFSPFVLSFGNSFGHSILPSWTIFVFFLCTPLDPLFKHCKLYLDTPLGNLFYLFSALTSGHTLRRSSDVETSSSESSTATARASFGSVSLHCTTSHVTRLFRAYVIRAVKR